MAKINKIVIIFLTVLAVLIIGWLVFRYVQKGSRATACIRSTCFDVEVADTVMIQAKGLMYRTELGRMNGMLFVFSKDAPHRFWMKNTLIPLDMIWTDKNGMIVHIEHSVPPCPSGSDCPNYGPDSLTTYVLEINAGLAKEFGFVVGDKLNISY